MVGILALLFSIAAYIAFFATFTYFVLFIGVDMTEIARAPKTLDWGHTPLENWPGPLVNIALVLLFGIQHSVMARTSFKHILTKVVPKAMERSLYVLSSVIVLIVFYYLWAPIPTIVWAVEQPIAKYALTALFLSGCLLLFASSFFISHFEMFGLQQGWRAFRKASAAEAKFRAPFLYAFIRHPLYLGILIALWSTPTMTVGHLLFSSMMTIYVFVGIGYEERDLLYQFGDSYKEYMMKTPMIFPFGKRK